MRDGNKAQDHHNRRVERTDTYTVVTDGRHYIQDTLEITFGATMGIPLVYTQTNNLEHLHTLAVLNVGYN